LAEIDKKTAEVSGKKIFLPDKRKVEFLGKSIEMKPVPIVLAKELRLLSQQLEESLQELGDKPKTSEMATADIQAIDLYLNVAQKILAFYGIGVSIDDMLKESTTSEIKEFVTAQLEVQGEEDFLFEPLRRITAIFFREKKKPLLE